MALSSSRRTLRMGALINLIGFTIAANAQIFQGALVVLDDGYARPGRAGQGADTAAKAADALTMKTVGIARHNATGTAVAGAVAIEVETGIYCFKNSNAGDAITIADIGNLAYVVDDETVAKTSSTATRVAAGRIMQVDADGVWVKIGPDVA